MIMMKQPSLAINSDDVPGPKYHMWQTIQAPRGVRALWTVNQILKANGDARKFQDSPLANVVINCHGDPGTLWIGGVPDEDGDAYGAIDDDVGVFRALKPHNIGTIWLVACQAAKGAVGKEFCQQLATFSGCQVVASDEYQEVGVWGTYRLLDGLHGQIDEFEGNVYRFTVTGGMQLIDPHEAIYSIKE